MSTASESYPSADRLIEAAKRVTVALGAALAAAIMLAAWGWLRPTPTVPVARFATNWPWGIRGMLRAFATTVARTSLSLDGEWIGFRQEIRR